MTTYYVCNTEEDGWTRRIGKGKGGEEGVGVCGMKTKGKRAKDDACATNVDDSENKTNEMWSASDQHV